jgi:hypothetical protein
MRKVAAAIARSPTRPR